MQELQLHQARNLASDRTIGQIEPVFEFYDAMPTGVSVAADGRIFVNYPRWGDDVPFTVAELRNGKAVPYPDAATNVFDLARPAETLSSVQSVVVDPANRLWLLDTAAPGFAAPLVGAVKLVAVDLATDKVVRTVILSGPAILPTTYVNDVRFDLPQGQGRRRLHHRFLNQRAGRHHRGRSRQRRGLAQAERPCIDLARSGLHSGGGGRALRRPGKGQATGFLTVASDGIAMSADGETLYYCPLSSRHPLFGAPTADCCWIARLPDGAGRAAAVVDLGEKGAPRTALKPTTRVASTPVTMSATASGGAGATENGSSSRTIPGSCGSTRSPWRLTDRHLYFTANQLHRQPQFHEGRDQREKLYVLFRIRIDAGPVLLK